MVDSIEEFFQVQIYHKAIACCRISLRGSYCILAASPRAISVAATAKMGIPDRGEHLKDRLLDHPVQDRRNPKRPHAAPAGLWYLHLPYRHRSIRPLEQLLSNTRPFRLKVRHQFFHGHPVGPWYSLVRPDTLEGSQHVLTSQHLL